MMLFTTGQMARFAASVNSDDAFRHWARDVRVTLALCAPEAQAGLSLVDGCIALIPPEQAQYALRGTEAEWRQALDTPYNAGYYDVFEGARLLESTVPPLLAASHAKAFTRLWKQLRTALNGGGRRWDWHV